MKNINTAVKMYQKTLNELNIPCTYKFLMGFMLEEKADFMRFFEGQFSVGNISPGYLDFTYFPFFNEKLRRNKLRFGIVLNHQLMRLELWLMGQNLAVQKSYWEQLKTSKWNQHLTIMPKYSVLECVLMTDIDFENTTAAHQTLKVNTATIVAEIMETLENIIQQ